MTQALLDIILPTYYEQNNIEKVLEQIHKYVKTEHVITIVLQDKNDPTLKEIKKLETKIKNINVLFTKDGKGMLKALKYGFNNTKASIITIMMADLSDDPRDIDKMVLEINNGFDLVCASRYSRHGKRVGGPMIKGLLSLIACKSLRLLTGLPTHDATNAFKCFKRSILKDIIIESEEGFELPLELTVKAYKKNLKIAEIPTIWKDREKGVSKFRLFRNLRFYLRWYLYGLKKSN